MSRDPLSSHIHYLSSVDRPFQWSWSDRRSCCEPRLRAIEQARNARERYATNVRAAHRQATQILGGIFVDLPDFDFRITPRIAEWMTFARSPRRVSILHCHANLQLRRVVSDLGAFTWYGGVKSADDVEARIRAWSRKHPLPDLWDVVRYRIVCDDINQLVSATRQLLTYFGDQVVRCRNYYVHPRNGTDDAYRAIHLELQYESEELVEIQLLTSNREAVGQIDHSMVLKKRVPPLGFWHVIWVRHLSWVANIMDTPIPEEASGWACLDLERSLINVRYSAQESLFVRRSRHASNGCHAH
jgi:Region found in RelA / SpoT proteins